MDEERKYEALATAFLDLWEDHLRASAAGKTHVHQSVAPAAMMMDADSGSAKPPSSPHLDENTAHNID